MEIHNDSIFAPAPLCVSRFNPDTKSIQLVCIGKGSQMYTIDGVSAFIWRQLDGKTPVEKILERILKEFEVTQARAKRDLKTMLDRFLAMEIIYER